MKALILISSLDGYPDFVWSGPGYEWPLYPRLFVCPWCCRPWAKFSIEGQPLHHFDSGSCEKCNHPTDFHPVPGSLLDCFMGSGLDSTLIDSLPEPLLRREFELHLRSPHVHNG